MITQKGIPKNSNLKKEILGAHPIIQFFIEKLGIGDLFATFIPQDNRLKISIEKTLNVLIHNILSVSMPMYEISDWASTVSESSIGLEENESGLINDDRVGKSLEQLYDGRHKDLFFKLALNAIDIFDINCSQIHQDTTTITFSGKYTEQEAREKITFGHNKDHRPDLKQLVLGMSITSDGAVPLAHKIYNGNQTDDTLHIENHRKITKLLNSADFIYVADSKLATEKNLEKIASYGGKFITVMPATWSESKLFKDSVKCGKVKWNHILSKENGGQTERKMDRYYLAEGEFQTQTEYRLLWYRSTQKIQRDLETRERRLAKSMDNLNALALKLNKYKFKTREKIKERIEQILKKNKCIGLIDYQLESERIFKKNYFIKGRPSSTSKGENSWKEVFKLKFAINEQEILNESLCDGVFPLLTNVFEDKSPKKILVIYKYQPFLEKRHSQIKTWQKVTPVLLKNSKRVVSYLHIHVIALMVSTLIERQLRLAMKNNQIEALPIYPEGRDCSHPTIFDIIRLFRNIEKYEVELDGKTTFFPANLNIIQKKILNLLAIPISLYQ